MDKNIENREQYQDVLNSIKVKNVVKDRTKAGKRMELGIRIGCLSDIHTGVLETINLIDKIRKGEKISEGELEISSTLFASIERALIDLEDMWGISISDNKEIFDNLEKDHRKSLQELYQS